MITFIAIFLAMLAAAAVILRGCIAGYVWLQLRDARTRVETKSFDNGVVFETFDEATGDHAVLHTNIISN